MINSLLTAAVEGLVGDPLSIIPQGNIGGIDIQATITEQHTDELEATEHPVESGAPITDHSFVRPARLMLECGWSNSNTLDGLSAPTFVDSTTMSVSDYVSGVYSSLLGLQRSRQPFTIVTSIRQYENMLFSSLRLHRDQKTSQALMVQAAFRQILIVSTNSTTLPAQANQANPQSTAETQNVGSVSTTSGTPNPGGSAPPSSWTSTL